MSVRITVTSNAGDVSRQFARLARTQLPFAQSRALTDVAKNAKGALTRTYPRYFKVRNKSLPRNAFAVRAARKTDFPNQRSKVGAREWAEFLTKHVEGGIRRGKRGHRIAVPTRRVKRTASGRIRKSQKPRQLRQRKSFIPRELELRQRIATKARGGSDKRRVWFNLRNRVRDRRRWPFYRIVRAEVALTYAPAFRKRLINAALSSKALR